MQISEDALTEFINLYKAEFDEDIDRDEARITARNLVTFYLDLEEGGVCGVLGSVQLFTSLTLSPEPYHAPADHADIRRTQRRIHSPIRERMR